MEVDTILAMRVSVGYCCVWWNSKLVITEYININDLVEIMVGELESIT